MVLSSLCLPAKLPSNPKIQTERQVFLVASCKETAMPLGNPQVTHIVTPHLTVMEQVINSQVIPIVTPHLTVIDQLIIFHSSLAVLCHDATVLALFTNYIIVCHETTLFPHQSLVGNAKILHKIEIDRIT